MNSKVPRPGLRRGSSAPPRKAPRSAPPAPGDLVGKHSDRVAKNSEQPAPSLPRNLAELSDPFAEPRGTNPFSEQAAGSDPFVDSAADPFADPAADAFDPFAESAEAAANQFKLPSDADDEFGGMPPTARAPIGLPLDISENEIQIEISEEEDMEIEEEAPESPPVSSRSPFGQSYLRARTESAETDRPTVRAPATYPDPELLDQLSKGDDDDEED